MQLANYPAVTAFGVATHRSQLKARTPLARNAGHSAARSVAKALGVFLFCFVFNCQVVLLDFFVSVYELVE